MSELIALLADPDFTSRLCMTLVHSIWQVAAILGCVWLVSRVGKLSLQRNYSLHVAGLFVALTLIPMTYAWYGTDVSEGRRSTSEAVVELSVEQKLPFVTDANVASAKQPVPIPLSPMPTSGSINVVASNAVAPKNFRSIAPEASTGWQRFAPGLVGFYVLGVFAMLARLLLVILRASRLGASATQITGGQLAEVLTKLCERWSMEVLPVLAWTERAVVPQVVGVLRPVILLPASAATGMSSEELEMILAHELAHVRRHDMWVNLLQRVAESLLFFNPALWFLSHRISALREYCCDEITCNEQPDAAPAPQLRYAQALLRVAAASRPDVNVELASVSAAGRSPSELRRRIARLFGEPIAESTHVSSGGVIAVASLALLFLLIPKVAESQIDPEQSKVASVEKPEISFKLKVVDSKGNAVPEAAIEIRSRPKVTAQQIATGTYVKDGPYGNFMKANANGELEMKFAKQPARMSISIEEPGYGPYWARWNFSDHGAKLPSEFTAELDDAWSVGGIVTDQAGQPIKGVVVRPSVKFKQRPGDSYDLGVGTEIRTGKDGSWRYDNVPVSMTDVFVEIDHPKFRPLRPSLPRSGFGLEKSEQPAKVLKLGQGLKVSGIVTDENGDPVKGAVIRTELMNDLRTATTDKQGRYELLGLEPRMARIVVSAKGKALDLQEVRIDPEMEPVSFHLKPGGKIRIRVVDKEGNGLHKARIFFQRWRGHIKYFEFDHINQYTDENGIWEWDEAPLDEFEADICHPRGMQIEYQPLVARDKEYVFAPPDTLLISGKVIDAKTKQPIPNFKVVQGLRNEARPDKIDWVRNEVQEAKNGEYRTAFRHTAIGHIVRIEAVGYKVAISKDFSSTDGKVEFDFELQPAKDLEAVLMSADGTPAVGARVALGVAGSQITIQNGRIDYGSTYASTQESDSDGLIRFPAIDSDFQLVVTHDTGFAHLKSVDGPIPDTIKLTPWARVEGTFRVARKAQPNVGIRLNVRGPQSYGNDVPHISCHNEVTTGVNGKFTLDRVFPGSGRIGRNITLMLDDGAIEVTSSCMVRSDFVSEETTKVDLGYAGRTVVGKLAAPDSHKGKVLWNFALISAELANEVPDPPEPPAEIAADNQQSRVWWTNWRTTETGQQWQTLYKEYDRRRKEFPYVTASIKNDGTFRLDDLPAGRYHMEVRFNGHNAGSLLDYLIVIPDDDSEGPIDLGIITLKP